MEHEGAKETKNATRACGRAGEHEGRGGAADEDVEGKKTRGAGVDPVPGERGRIRQTRMQRRADNGGEDASWQRSARDAYRTRGSN